jgi:carbamoyl-phosphate synthase small subunit
VRHLRDHGSQEAVLSSVDLNPERLVRRAKDSPGLVGRDLVREVTCQEPYEWTQGPWRLGRGYTTAEQAVQQRGGKVFDVVAYDFGIKWNILRNLVGAGCRVRVVPAYSNGPGDPDAVSGAPERVAQLLGNVPVFGICLGHQIMGLALGGRTFKLKFGHHGGNQPVKDLTTGKVEITAQNHGFAVDVESLRGRAEITHINLNDRTCEGLSVKGQPTFSVQYHPEASPGPHDARYLFRRFVEMMERGSLPLPKGTHRATPPG